MLIRSKTRSGFFIRRAYSEYSEIVEQVVKSRCVKNDPVRNLGQTNCLSKVNGLIYYCRNALTKRIDSKLE